MSRLTISLGLLRSLVIYYGLPWRRRSLARFYRTLVPEGALVFDVGAHVGSRTRSLLANGAHCVAIEPQPAFAQLLQKLFSSHPRVSLVTEAVGREPGQAKLHVSSRHPTVSTLSSEWVSRVAPTRGFETVAWDQTVTVAVTTLDTLIAEHGLPAFCKIDVEGMEAEILSGLSVAIPIVAVEYIPATIDIALTCVERLETLGAYEYNVSPGETHTMHFTHWVDADTLVCELQRIASDGVSSGDLYARLVDTTSIKTSMGSGS
ncbi:MAG: FkbM family methyltransferase [Granulosicoccus sp.]